MVKSKHSKYEIKNRLAGLTGTRPLPVQCSPASSDEEDSEVTGEVFAVCVVAWRAASLEVEGVPGFAEPNLQTQTGNTLFCWFHMLHVSSPCLSAFTCLSVPNSGAGK